MKHLHAAFGAVIAFAAIAQGGRLAAQSLPPASVAFPAGESVVELPLERQDGLIVVSVQIRGISRPLRMILDSGAPVMVLADPGLAAGLAYPVLAQAQVEGGGDGPIETVPLVSGVAGSVGGLRLTEGLMLLGGIQRTRLPIDGVLGRSLLDNVVLEIDWDHDRLRLHEPRAFVYDGDGEILGIEINAKRQLETNAAIGESAAREVPVRLVIDTGARQALGLVVSEKLPKLTGERVRDTVVGWGSRGPGRGDVARVPRLRLGRVDLENVATMLVRQRPTTADGWIGIPALRRFRFFLDVPGKRLILEPGNNLDGPFHFNTTGLVIAPTAPGSTAVDVFEVIPGSPAAAAGILAGDRITTIDGQAVAALDHDSLTQILVVPEVGSEIRLGIARSEQRIEANIRAKDLL